MSVAWPFLEARELSRSYVRGRVRVLSGVSFRLERGRTLGILGESGSGKSTLVRLLLGLLEPHAGKVLYEGVDPSELRGRERRAWRRRVQAVFQDPAGSLDPRLSVESSLAEPLRVQGWRDRRVIRERVEEALDAVELTRAYLSRRPHQMSGGECQRVAIARALVLQPELIVLDEPVSSLDLVVQAQVLNLLLRLQLDKGLSYILVSHDLKVIRHLAHDVLVLRAGQVCEAGPCEQVFGQPTHPYTRLLIETSL
ncbi:MAG: putative ABC transporter ATP-binding protein [Candidatus Omnitrophica bacterium]|nr:putative ABC transporter ATP-binding protein [Candidatus Omnitrophota bacterium]